MIDWKAEAHAMAGTAANDVFAVDIRATAENVGRVRRLLVAFAAGHGASAVTCDEIALAASEAMSNAIIHGYGGDPNGIVHVIADIEDGVIEVLVTDDGRGMRTPIPSDGLGLGLGLIAEYSSRMTIREREPSGTEICMQFLVP